MTKKKRELIEILLDNVKPEDWPESLPYAAHDKCDSAIYVYSGIPDITSIYNGCWHPGSLDCKFIKTVDVICKFWNKTIVHRDEFMKRWNERNMVVDSEGWIQWNGGEMPVEKGTLIDVKYRDGSMTSEVFYTCDNEFRYSRNWCRLYSEKDIIAYRLHAPKEQKTPQQLAIDKFGADWHENEGVQPVNDKVLIDLIMCNGDEKKKYLANHWSWHKEQALKIKKWRIHSDEKESQIDKAAKSLSEGVEKLNGVLLTAQQAFDGFNKAAESIGSLVTDDAKKYRWVTPEMLACLSSEYEKTFSIKPQSATDTQIGGDHYTKLAIQPMQYSMKNGLDPLQHTIIKYVTRFRDKAGIEDLEKAKHCIDMLIEYEKEQR